jgi:hypothetical protein
MEKLFQAVPEIIANAAKNPLGIVALIVIALSVIAYFFFSSASERARLLIFVMMFLGAVGVGSAIFLGQHTVEPPLSPPPPATVDVPVQINGNIFEEIKATHTFSAGDEEQGTIAFKFMKKTNKKPIDVVVEKAGGGEITTSGHINENGRWRIQRTPLAGLAGERIKIFRWAPGFVGAMGSGGGDAFLTLPKKGNVEVSIVVKD